MAKSIVLYQSKYGATKKYANWLKEELSCDIMETKKASADAVEKYDIIILGGGLYASGIAGLSFIKKNYHKLKDKKVIIFAVGASPYDERSINMVKEHNLKDELSNIPLVYLRGAWNEEKMTFIDRSLCNMLKKSVAKKDQSKLEPWEAALMEAIGGNYDWTDKKYIESIIELVNI
ncbi:flavodoxin domain-containing protein [Tissierella sp. Yu-01]|uniref:flavodoxin domain-containing protein n=1 Tax=Tissierella sp. Yu-01 TaxID=3035694 RepID=UPI00240E3B70|nr:flavodoxin domain-containing protein [Tissierella sp. Yu-01]WFA08984.1 flavodoxin domain-containing protein [Tissierella sp. Yu-01]WFA09006.1 flavodoxin domain-containing protein [Tissierella sp. Yu-01]